ncbi:MAG: cysteine--tRNA ligase [Clostridiales bacterium]|nr:cysteine--tRNA ligase [Clostridiales bacterium]
MDLKFYNTLTRKKEDFVPIDPKLVRMYSCGPTVYNYAHIGNMRAYVFMDTLRRVLTYAGYKVKSVMNITDVGHLLSDADDGEDKMEKSAREQKKTPKEIADAISAQFFDDLKALNINRPTVTPKATDNIPEMIEIVVALLEKGYAYETDDGIYFSVEKFPRYGQLSGINLDDQKSGARVEVNDQKRHPADFALWKKAQPNHIQQWDSPWGMGFPGWHIECTAMSNKYLGSPFDIHTGGIDHIPIHHENEIAQSECWLDKKCVNYWMHGEFMLFDGGKMSKSLGNCYLLSQLNEMGYSAMDFRYFCLNTHYRQKLNFTFDTLAASKTAYNRLLTLLRQHFDSDVRTEESVLKAFDDEFNAAISDDLNVPMALGLLWKMLKLPKSKDVCLLAQKWDAVFGLNLDKLPQPEKQQVNAPQEVIDLAEERLVARKNKDWAKSDELRAKIKASGYDVKDTATGYELSKS